MAQLNSKQSIERREVLNRNHLKFRDELRAVLRLNVTQTVAKNGRTFVHLGAREAARRSLHWGGQRRSLWLDVNNYHPATTTHGVNGW